MAIGPECACGCGEHLPQGSTRKYKRGHRANVNKRESAALDREYGLASNPQFDGYHDLVGNTNEPPVTTPFYAFSLEDAANDTPDDPDTDIWANVDITKELPIAALKDIEGKLAFMLGSTAGLVNVIDPVCGGAFLENTRNIAHTLTPIIAQSPGIVQWFTKTSNTILYINLSMALWPVISAIYTHHFVKHEASPFNPAPENGQMNIPTDMYVVR